jgi:hypothetical protein
MDADPGQCWCGRNAVSETDPTTDFAEDPLLDRILGTQSVLVALRCEDTAALIEHLCASVVRSGQAVYFWRARSGLCRLPGRDEAVPGVVHLADVLRFVARSAHFGVYFLADPPSEWSYDLLTLLRRIAQIDPQQPRRLVLLGTLADFPATLAARELTWGRRRSMQLRLRDGAWIR